MRRVRFVAAHPAPQALALWPAARPRLATLLAGSTVLVVLTLLGACAPAVPAKPAPASPPTLAELMQRPAERALVEGIRHYDEGQYTQAETQLRRALAAGLADGRDRASAHKLLAFIACASERLTDCAQQFSAARAADPAFQLSRSESGHPVWGPIYRRMLAP